MVFGLDDLAEGFVSLFGGGGGGGSSVNYGVVSTIQGGAKPVDITQTIQGGQKALAVDSTIGGGTKDVGVNLALGLDDVNIDVGGTGTPLQSTTTLGFANTFESETAVDFDLDVQPVQVDLCLNVGLTKLPKACIRQPYDAHFGVTLLGTELVGFDVSGESNVIIDEVRDRPHVELGRAVQQPRPRPTRGRRSPRVARGPSGGFRIRID